MSSAEPMRIALLGAPNCGKTSLFNALTGGRAKVANYPGATVEYQKGMYATSDGRQLELLDLPGVYGDCGHSADERVTIDAIHGRLEGEKAPDGIAVVLDAAHIKTHLHNVLQAKNYGLPMIVVLNMMDMAARDGVEIDLVALEEEIGVPVVSSVAVRSAGRAALVELLDSWTTQIVDGKAVTPTRENRDLKILQQHARAITSRTIQATQVQSRSARIDNIILHPVLGVLILISILFVMFQAVYAWAGPAMDVISGGTDAFGAWVGSHMSDGWFKSLIVGGAITGVGAVIVFLPQILILFAFILALEASGYMARAAFLVDSLMAKVGLNGRAFIPLLSSFACAIPGIMAARTIESEKDRLTTILIAPLMTCSARLPVYLIIIGAFIPAKNIGMFNQQGLVMFGLYMAGIVFALIAAFFLKKTVTSGEKPSLLLEMPSYKIPSFKSYLIGLWQRAMIFVNRAGRIILPASIVIWFLSYFPNKGGPIRESFAGMLGRVLEPVLAPIGFNLEMSIALIPAMAAREVAVSALSIVYNVDDEDGAGGILEGALAADWTMPMALAFLAWFVFAPQCLSTFAVTRRETNSWKWPFFMFGYLFVMAYVAAGLTFWVATWAGL
ncbi:MAG: ferrous iron transport protein B [Acidimicrobiales bacterium]|nr:MAG: ferrous iron transport protein B [Acidimicrobiales bacterium]